MATQNAAENSMGVAKIDASRANDMLTLNNILATHRTDFHNTLKLFDGPQGGRIAELRQRGFKHEQIERFVGDFTMHPGLFDTKLLDNITLNLKKQPKENFIDLWEQGVHGRNLAVLANAEDGGLLGELNKRKLGTQSLATLIGRAAGDDVLLDNAEVDHLQAFNDTASKRANEWAQNLIREDLPVPAMTKALGDSVVAAIINERHLGHERIGRIVKWAYDAAGGNLDTMIQKLNEYNENARSQKRGALRAAVDSGQNPFT